MARFPLSVVPTQNYHYGGIKFGAERKKKDGSLRTHAACDLVAAPGTPVVAVEWGIVLDVPKTPFIEGTRLYSVIIEHSFFIGRYTEINRDDIGSEIYPGATVQEGQYISTLQRNGKGGAMLHFEMYDKSSAGYLSQPSNTKYKNVPAGSYGRRSDLMNPTPYLDQWLLWTVWL